MPGKRAVEGADYVTGMAPYRSCLAAVDSGGPQDTDIPILDTRIAPNTGVGLGQGDNNQYGRSGQINVAAIAAAGVTYTLQLWLLAVLDVHVVRDESSSSSSSNDCDDVTTGEWVLVDTLSGAAQSRLWRIQNIPPGLYKVLVSATTGGTITLRTQYAA